MHLLSTTAWLIATACACTAKTQAPETTSEKDSEAPRLLLDAAFSQAPSCDDAAPDTFEQLEPSGSWPIQIGVPIERTVFNLFGPGCDIPVLGTFQGSQYARLAVRFAGEQDRKVFAQFTLRSLITPDAGAARDNNFSVEQTAICESDGYCYVTPVLANIVTLADEQDALRGHPVQIDVLLFDAENEQRFGRMRTWGRLLFPE